MLFSNKRGYVSPQILDEYLKRHTTLAIKLNNYINATGTKDRPNVD